jgi:CDP-diacylglycerol--serine O-phosphatidyltransferase
MTSQNQTPPAHQRRKMNLWQLLPNFVTVAALIAGLTAVRFAAEGRFGFAVALIIAAAVLDGLDGRIARLLKSESAIGAELDSLCDFVNFGVAPALILYLWALQDMRSEGWIAALVYTVACLLRLARFNVGSRAPDYDGSSFQGVPSPAGAMLVLLPIFLANTLGIQPAAAAPIAAPMIALWMVAVGALMVARFATPSFKRVTVYAEAVSFVVLGFVVLVAALLTYPWVTLALADITYLVLLIWGLLQRKPKSP